MNSFVHFDWWLFLQKRIEQSGLLDCGGFSPGALSSLSWRLVGGGTWSTRACKIRVVSRRSCVIGVHYYGRIPIILWQIERQARDGAPKNASQTCFSRAVEVNLSTATEKFLLGPSILTVDSRKQSRVRYVFSRRKGNVSENDDFAESTNDSFW